MGFWNLVACHFLSGYFRFLQWTVQFDQPLLDEVKDRTRKGLPVVLTTPHTALLPAVLALRGTPATFMASQSHDGGLISFVLERAGFEMVRASSSRGGAAGLTKVMRALRKGRVVGLTHDGPRGPALVPKPGIALLGRLGGAGCFLLIPEFQPRALGFWPGFIRLGSWDRFHLVLPFARIKMLCIPIPSGDAAIKDLKSDAAEEAFLKTIELLSFHHLGFLYPESACKKEIT